MPKWFRDLEGFKQKQKISQKIRWKKIHDKKTLDDIFWERVDKRKDTECWPWTGTIHLYGYGQVGWKGIYWMSHRLSWIVNRGPIPKGLSVLHHCDNRKCVNPAHLFLGDQIKNNEDARSKGRTPLDYGERNWFAKLKQNQVDEIRNRHCQGENQTRLASIFMVSQGNISRIINRKRWCHS